MVTVPSTFTLVYKLLMKWIQELPKEGYFSKKRTCKYREKLPTLIVVCCRFLKHQRSKSLTNGCLHDSEVFHPPLHWKTSCRDGKKNLLNSVLFIRFETTTNIWKLFPPKDSVSQIGFLYTTIANKKWHLKRQVSLLFLGQLLFSLPLKPGQLTWLPLKNMGGFGPGCFPVQFFIFL